VQLYIHPGDEPLPESAAPDLEAQLHRLAVFDVLANNADRKRAHLLVDGVGHVWGIDNALTFLPTRASGRSSSTWAGATWTPTTQSWCGSSEMETPAPPSEPRSAGC